MLGWFARATVGAALFGAAFSGLVQASEPTLPSATFGEVGAPTSIPYGWVDFCRRRPEECNLGKLTPREIHLTKQVLATLNKVNIFANSAIEPISNLDHWGTMLDHWDYPTDGKGDCKVYALFKRKQLIDQGFPRQALLMTIVRDQDGEGHAVLTVKTDRGDFVLDNLTDEILPWDETGYRFIKRQAQDDPNVWLAMTGAAATVASGD
jgi:predicted transglutaminase-like cysteine proteinase